MQIILWGHYASAHYTVTMSALSGITSKLSSGSYRIRSVSSGKSEVWKIFGLVVDENGDDLDYAACKFCHYAISYRGRVTGTTTLKKHKCKSPTGNQVRNIIFFPKLYIFLKIVEFIKVR